MAAAIRLHMKTRFRKNSTHKEEQGVYGRGHKLPVLLYVYSYEQLVASSQSPFLKERKEPLTDERHVRDAIARFDQVEGVTNKERDEAWKRIQQAAKRFDIQLQEQSWQELFILNDRSIPKA